MYDVYDAGTERSVTLMHHAASLAHTNTKFVNVVSVLEGFKTKEQLADYYAAADVFVLPTREDIWGLVVNEAFAFGLPVITSDNCGAGMEMITQGVNGFIFPNEDADALRDMIVKALCLNCFEASTKTAACYTLEEMAEKTLIAIDGSFV